MFDINALNMYLSPLKVVMALVNTTMNYDYKLTVTHQTLLTPN